MEGQKRAIDRRSEALQPHAPTVPSTTSFSCSLPPQAGSGVSIPTETGAAHRRLMRDKETRRRLGDDLQTRIRPFPHPRVAPGTLLPREPLTQLGRNGSAEQSPHSASRRGLRGSRAECGVHARACRRTSCICVKAPAYLCMHLSCSWRQTRTRTCADANVHAFINCSSICFVG